MVRGPDGIRSARTRTRACWIRRGSMSHKSTSAPGAAIPGAQDNNGSGQQAVCAADDTAFSSAASRQETACRRCGVIAVHCVETGQWGPHTRRLMCQDCGSWIRWLSDRPPVEQAVHVEQSRRAAMARKPASEAQLRYLRHLGYRGPQPESMAEAADRIAILLHGRRR